MLPECTRHPEGLALLQKCKENPLDMAPRLILADWLDDQGEEAMARIIRMAASGNLEYMNKGFPSSWLPLNSVHQGWLGCETNQVSKLVNLQILQSPWLSNLELLIENNAQEQITQFLAEVCDSSLLFLKIRFEGSCYRLKQAMKLLADSNKLRYVTSLNVAGGLSDQELAILAESSIFRRLSSFHIQGNFKKRWSSKALAQSPMLASVKNFVFSSWQNDPDWIIEIADSPHLRNLDSLDFSGSFSDEGHRILAESPIVNNLKNLRLYWSGISHLGAASLANSAKLRSLQNLNIHHSIDENSAINVGNSGCQAIANSPYFQNLKQLVLINCEIDADGARSIAMSSSLQNLEEIFMWMNPIGDGFTQFSQSKYLQNLKQLTVTNGEIDDAIASEFIRSPLMLQLNLLNLKSNQMGDQSMKALAEYNDLPNLKSLDLNRNQITDDGVDALIKSKYLPNLKSLSLLGNPIGKNGQDALIEWADTRGIDLLVDYMGY